MSSNELIFESSRVPISTSLLTPDADGYVTINAGAYNIYNASGVYYDGNSIDKLYGENSILKRRIDKRVVFAELGHPKKEPWMNDSTFDSRLLEIREDRYCGHIRKAFLVPNKDSKVIITKIEVAPFGHYSSTLRDAILSKHANCYFSVRSFSNQLRVNGILVKRVYQIITWDFVTEGGLNKANKFDTDVDLESMDSKQLMDNIKTNEMMNIDLNNTSEVKYVLKHFEEYRRSNLDKESNETVSVITNLLGEAVTSKDSDIFKWK